jgi:hypothetical protein
MQDFRVLQDETKIRIYAYRLCSDFSTSPIKLEKHKLEKEKWFEVRKRIPELEKWIRNENNPNGIVEFKIYDPYEPQLDILANRKIYTSEELFAMNRNDLIAVCESWDVGTIRKKKERLISELLTKFSQNKL